MENFNELDAEIIRRIEEQESETYDFGPPLNRADRIGIAVVLILSIVGITVGYYA
jgi:hypothetical protein